MNSVPPGRAGTSLWVDHIPVLWMNPAVRHPGRQLVVCLPGLSGTKESMAPFLNDLAAAGLFALSLDPWQHGERSTETREQISQRVFGNFRRHFWPILGNTALDTLRVIDWAVATLEAEPPVYLLGTSMGGDIAVAAAGLDHRIMRVATVASTPDWLRPGMRGPGRPETPMPQGEPDGYAQYFYDHLDPLTHLDSYVHGPAIRFVCGEQDDHVRPDGALRFQRALGEKHPSAAGKVEASLIPGKGHMDLVDPGLWWPGLLEWLTRR